VHSPPGLHYVLSTVSVHGRIVPVYTCARIGSTGQPSRGGLSMGRVEDDGVHVVVSQCRDACVSVVCIAVHAWII
jgi:hypothetical protein